MGRLECVSIHLVDTLEAIEALRKVGCTIYYPVSEENTSVHIQVEGTPGLDNEWNGKWREYLEMYRPRIEEVAPVLWDAYREVYPEAPATGWYPVSEASFHLVTAREARH
jgi:hypothetical protein